MAIIRISVLLSIFLLAHSLSTHTSISSQNLHHWQATYLNSMAPEDLQLIANFLYISYAVSVAELKVRQFSTPFSRLQQSIKAYIINYQDCSQELATFKTLVDRLAFVLGTRTIYAEMLRVCTQYCNDHANPAISAALESIQLDAQHQLCVWADQQKEQTGSQLAKFSHMIGSNLTQLQGASELHHIMSQGSLPLELPLPQEQEPFTSLIIIDTVLKSNHKLQIILNGIINSMNETTDYAEQIISVGAEIYKDYYMTIRHMLMAPTIDKKYATTLFSMHDLLPDEYKTILPDADHVFEHMLQTAKLYTQAELVQKP